MSARGVGMRERKELRKRKENTSRVVLKGKFTVATCRPESEL